MRHFPIFLDLVGKPVLVVGTAPSAATKAEQLARAGADVRRADRFDGLGEAVLVVVGDADEALGAEVAQAARAEKIPVNVVDRPELCDFVWPAIVDRDPITIAISTAGTSPVLARQLRARIETLVPAAYGQLAAFAGGLRARVARAIPDARARRMFWDRVLGGRVGERVLAGDEAGAARELDRALLGAGSAKGHVSLVGSGPGDPELLTLKALRRLQEADAIVHDRLVDSRILDLARRDAERIDAGKTRGRHTMRQGDIESLLVRLAGEGKRVVRLKGGDPFVFGRGGEEIEALAQAGIDFDVVPGITAALGCAAYVGIPLTHRDHAQACVFVTGHTKDGELDLDFRALANPRQTLAIHMGSTNLGALRRGLMRHGLPGSTPVALISRGTRPDQRVEFATLGTLESAAARVDLSGPMLTVVGRTVALAAGYAVGMSAEAPVSAAS
ncbi:MAG: siroheme synthase CysG [Tagaea sp.]|nr:siroheme synthase CysG [Tagaea sp.]